MWDRNPNPPLDALPSTGGGLYKFPLPTVGHFLYGSSLSFLKVSHLAGFRHILEDTPTSVLSAGPQVFSPVPHDPNT